MTTTSEATAAVATLAIGPRELAARTERLVAHLRERELRGAVLFDSVRILYYTGFAFIPTERPIVLCVSRDGERVLLVPRLELEHAQGSHADRVETYEEYPGLRHPLTALGELIGGLGMTSSVAADLEGPRRDFGYRGPGLRELVGEEPVDIAEVVDRHAAVKSPAELRLIRESVTWANLAHTLLQRYTCAGASEVDVGNRASDEATRAMLDAIGPLYRACAVATFVPQPTAMYRGQVGRSGALPHALANDARFRAGDTLVTGAAAPVWGYTSELERTMFVGEPSAGQRRLFEHMLALQETAFAAIRPGVACADVDRAVMDYYERHDLLPQWRHHTGHAIGLRYHDAPYLDVGDETLLEAGMVFTVEPGLYDPELGGFRHSDTLVVTDAGCELLTYYARDLDALTIA